MQASPDQAAAPPSLGCRNQLKKSPLEGHRHHEEGHPDTPGRTRGHRADASAQVTPEAVLPDAGTSWYSGRLRARTLHRTSSFLLSQYVQST
jgi:hypothetical protein